MKGFRPWLAPVWLAGSAPFLAAQETRLPELPTLNLSDSMPGIREQIEDAEWTAQARPDDASATGKLGTVP